MARRSVLLGVVLAIIALPGRGDAAGWRVEPVTVTTSDPAVTLAGTLRIPEGPGPHPAVVLVSGSGGHLREQIISGLPMFRVMADWFVSRGVAVLGVDDRGEGFSTGPNVYEGTTADRAQDVRACLTLLRAHTAIDGERIGVVGHSEGAMIACMLAASDDPPAFQVLLGAPGVSGRQVWLDQTIGGFRRRGGDEETAADVRAAFEKMIDAAVRGFEDDAEYYALGRDVLRAHGLEEDRVTDELVDQIASDFRRPWYPAFWMYDPAAFVPSIRTPTLALWGAADRETPVDPNAAAFEALVHDEARSVVDSGVIEKVDHFFLWGAGLEPGEHRYGGMAVSDEMMERVADWVLAQGVE